MNKKVITYIGIASLTILFVAVLGGAGLLYTYINNNMEVESEIPAADNNDLVLAPDFGMEKADGEIVRLSDFRGKPVVLNFWASWCPPCKAEMPDFDAAYKKYGEEIEFIMLNTTGGRETVATAKKFIEGTSYSFPVYFDTTYEASYVYGVSSIPQTFFIDAEGKLVGRSTGQINSEILERGISMIK